MNQEVINVNLEQLKKHQASIAEERKRLASEATKSIVDLVRKETGWELSPENALSIYTIITCAQ